MSTLMIDSNIILDLLTQDPQWYDWSASQLARLGNSHLFAINPIIYAEVSARFSTIEDLEAALPASAFLRSPIPWEASFLAAKAFVRYKKNGGQKKTTLPDFFIGAHALVHQMTLLTRDSQRYRTYFPSLTVIAPDTVPI